MHSHAVRRYEGTMSETNDTGTQAVESPAIETDTSTTPSETVEAQETTETPAPAANDEKDAVKQRPWFEKIIAADKSALRENRRQIEDNNRQIGALQAALQRQTQPQQQQQNFAPPGMVPVAEVERLIDQRSEQRVNLKQFNDACDAVVVAGESKFSDFKEASNNFSLMGDIPMVFFEVIADLGKDDGARVYYDLGKNPAEAARVLALPPAKMAIALAKMASATPPAKPVSKAPAPITPLSGNANVSGNAEPDGKDMKQWATWFNKQRNRS